MSSNRFFQLEYHLIARLIDLDGHFFDPKLNNRAQRRGDYRTISRFTFLAQSVSADLQTERDIFVYDIPELNRKRGHSRVFAAGVTPVIKDSQLY